MASAVRKWTDTLIIWNSTSSAEVDRSNFSQVLRVPRAFLWRRPPKVNLLSPRRQQGFNRFDEPIDKESKSVVRRKKMTTRYRISIVHARCWLILAMLALSGSPLRTCAAAAAATSAKNYYSVLGVEPGVSQESLKRAYRQAAVKWHPDKNTGNKELAERKFKEIQQAYDTLKEPRSRGDYDDSLRNAGRPRPTYNPYGSSARNSNDPGDFFSTGFYARMREQGAAAGRHFGGPSPARRGGGMGGAGSESPFEGVRMNLFDVFRFGSGERENLGIPKARWRNLHVKLVISLEELLSGAVKEIDIADSILERYKQAARTGLLSEVVQEGAAVFGALLLRCPLSISAVAFAAYVHLKLPRVPKGAFRVPILPGYRRGTKITFATPEEVDVTFEIVEKPSQFRRSGDDLFVLVRLTPKMVKRGCTVKVPTLDKGKVSLRLKRGEASDGHERRLPGLGMPSRVEGSKGNRGDLVVHFMVEGSA